MEDDPNLDRLEWAERNFKILKQVIDDTRDRSVYLIITNYDADLREYVLDMRIDKPIEGMEDWSFIAGDIIHDLRSTLDNWAYRMVEIHGGDRARIQFPICDTCDDFFGRGKNVGDRKRYLDGMAEPAANAIEMLQPYRTPNLPHPHELTVLRKLSNTDKHRHFLFCGIGAEPLRFRLVRDGKVIHSASYSGVFKNGTVCRMPDPTGEAKVEMDTEVVTDVAFALKPPMNVGVRESIGAIIRHIREIVYPGLKPFL